MKNILKAVSLFAMALFVSFAIIGCGSNSKDQDQDQDPITEPYQPPDVAPQNVPENGNQTVKDYVNGATMLPLANYRIVKLYFDSHVLSDDNMSDTFHIDGNDKSYPFVIGVEYTSNTIKRTAYFDISDSQWELLSNIYPEIYKQNGRLIVNVSFYSDINAMLVVKVKYKGLDKFFYNAIRPIPRFPYLMRQ